MWKDMAIAWFEVLPWHLLEATEETPLETSVMTSSLQPGKWICSRSARHWPTVFGDLHVLLQFVFSEYKYISKYANVDCYKQRLHRNCTNELTTYKFVKCKRHALGVALWVLILMCCRNIHLQGWSNWFKVDIAEIRVALQDMWPIGPM
jgi:hypothetical protein